MGLEGFEVVAKIMGVSAKNTATLLYSTLREEQRTRGKARLTNMSRSRKELKAFTVKSGDLKKFTQEAKRYGVFYCVLADRGNKNPNAEADVMAHAEDASKINRIVERFSPTSVSAASTMTEVEKLKGVRGKLKNAKATGGKDAETKDGQPEPDIGAEEKAEKDRLVDALMGGSVEKEENAPNLLLARIKKSPLSEPTLKQQRKSAEGATMTKAEKSLIREELRKIKERRKEQEADISFAKEKSFDRVKRPPTGKTEYKQSQKRKRRSRSKEER